MICCKSDILFKGLKLVGFLAAMALQNLSSPPLRTGQVQVNDNGPFQRKVVQCLRQNLSVLDEKAGSNWWRLLKQELPKFSFKDPQNHPQVISLHRLLQSFRINVEFYRDDRKEKLRQLCRRASFWFFSSFLPYQKTPSSYHPKNLSNNVWSWKRWSKQYYSGTSRGFWVATPIFAKFLDGGTLLEWLLALSASVVFGRLTRVEAPFFFWRRGGGETWISLCGQTSKFLEHPKLGICF